MSTTKRRDYVAKNMNKHNRSEIHKSKKDCDTKTSKDFIEVYEDYIESEIEYINELITF